MTPVFGLETDESLEVQQIKKEYAVLKSKGANLTKIEAKKMIQVSKKVKATLPTRDINLTNPNELKLLQKIELKLNIKK